MKKKLLLTLYIIILLVSCDQSNRELINNDFFSGRSFNLTSIEEKDTLVIDFKDSTYSVFEYDEINLPYRIKIHGSSNALVLNGRAVLLLEKKDTILTAMFVGEKDTELTFLERNTNWNRNMLNGKWIQETYYGKEMTDSPPPPPPGPELDSINGTEILWPPFYEISNDSIFSFYYTRKDKSKIEVSNTIEFIDLNLKTYFGEHLFWKVKSLTDSTLIAIVTIERSHYPSNHIINEEVKFVKKR